MTIVTQPFFSIVIMLVGLISCNLFMAQPKYISDGKINIKIQTKQIVNSLYQASISITNTDNDNICIHLVEKENFSRNMPNFLGIGFFGSYSPFTPDHMTQFNLVSLTCIAPNDTLNLSGKIFLSKNIRFEIDYCMLDSSFMSNQEAIIVSREVYMEKVRFLRVYF